MDNKSALLASLTGEATGDSSPDQDLFGDVDIDDKPVANGDPFSVTSASDTVASNGGGNEPAPATIAPAAPVTAAAVAPPPPRSSLLSKSGLLGGDGGADLFGSGGGGGMFDEIDQEQAELERKAAEAAAAEQERQRKEEAERAAAAEQERIRKEQEAEQQRQMQMQRQQQQQMQMQQQQMHYGQQPQYGQPVQYGQQPQYGQQSQYGQQQQQQQQPMQSRQQSFQQKSSMMHSQSSVDQSQILSDQMQSISLGNSTVLQPNNNAQFQNQQQMQQPQMNFYRDHSAVSVAGSSVSGMTNTNASVANPPVPSNAYSGGFANRSQLSQGGTANAGTYYYGTQQQQQQGPQSSSPQRLSPQRIVGTTTAGMHNAMAPSPYGGGRPGGSMGQPPRIVLTKPPTVQPMYSKINVSEPMLIQSSSFFLASPPYWSYQISTQLANNAGIWLVRRRFRHVVALEDRLRQVCPGCILPPRPDKHATRAIEEASAQQSAEFAVQRAAELQVYLTRLATHPIAGHSNVLRLFLGLQDDIGTAWAEVSPNALTRLTAVGAGVGTKVAESTSSSVNLLPWKDGNAGPSASPASGMPAQDLEDNAELLALQSAETLRMGAVVQAVPKLEGAVALCIDLGDASGALGMEMSKFAKTTENTNGADDSWSKSTEILSSGLLRHGRRTKRLALELSAALEPFVLQYKLCRYEKLAFHDRRQALQRRSKERFRADSRASQLYQQQHQMQAGPYGHNQLDQLQRSAIVSDDMAIGAMHDADAVASTLRWEINRVSYQRRKDWHSSMKVVASSFKEASAERAAIWQATYEAFGAAFPDLNIDVGASSIGGGGSVGGSVTESVASNPNPPQQPL